MSDTITRGITFTVAKTWPDGPGTRTAFQKTLSSLWREGTMAANWCLREFAKQDCECGEPGKKLPACPKFRSLTKDLRKRFASLSANTLDTIRQQSQKKYGNTRLDVWRGAQTLASYRYPMPYPVRDGDWTPFLLHGERPAVCFNVGLSERMKFSKDPCPHCDKRYTVGGTRQHITLVLQGGPGFKRQLAQFRQILDGTAEPRDMAIYRQRRGDTHRNGTTEKKPGGASRVEYDTMIKLVARYPVPKRVEGDDCLLLRTDPEALWTATHSDRVINPWVLNGDDAKKWLACIRDLHLDHAAKRQRMSQDLKVEKRTHVGQYAQHLGRLDAMCSKHRNRLKTFTQQCAAGIVGYCVRRKIATLIYDDTNREWMPSFPWSALRVELRSRCEAAGITAGGVLLSEDDDRVEEVAVYAAE